MKYLLIDSPIWVRVISQGKPGCEVAHLEDLRKLIEESKVVLLLPEVIELELEKNWRSFTEDVQIQIGKLEKELDALLRKQFWTEIEDVQRSLGVFLADQKAKKITAATERYKQVRSLLASPKIVRLPFTPEINFRGKRRLMAGRMPKPENRAHSDACILESLADFFPGAEQKADHQLCFCSENVGDFGLAAKDRHIIHPLHKDDLPDATEYCISLAQAVAFLKSEEKAVVPSPALIEEALRQRTEEEAEAEIEMENEPKPEEMCAESNCYARRHHLSRYCPAHYRRRFNRLSPEQREEYAGKLARLLKTLSYRERELLKLRWGLGDGYKYTPAECGRIFKISSEQVTHIVAKAIRKLQHPVRRRIVDAML